MWCGIVLPRASGRDIAGVGVPERFTSTAGRARCRVRRERLVAGGGAGEEPRSSGRCCGVMRLGLSPLLDG